MLVLLLLQADERDIEAGIVVMRQRGLPQDAAERAVGLPAGVLSAVVDGQGHWLDEQAQSGAAIGLPAEQLQQLALLLGRMRDHLQDMPERAVEDSASSSLPMRPLQEDEVSDFIRKMSQQIEPFLAGVRPAQQPPGFAATVQDIAARYRQQKRESKAAWAKRIHLSEAPLRARPFAERIAVLAAVTWPALLASHCSPRHGDRREGKQDTRGPKAERPTGRRRESGASGHWPIGEDLTPSALPYISVLRQLQQGSGTQAISLSSRNRRADIIGVSPKEQAQQLHRVVSTFRLQEAIY